MRSHVGVGTQAESVREWGVEGEFGTKRDGVTGEWRKLHNEDLTDMY